MHRLATVHARDNQPTNDQRRHDTAYLNKRLFYYSKVRRLKNLLATGTRWQVQEASRVSRSDTDAAVLQLFLQYISLSASACPSVSVYLWLLQ